VAAAEKLVRAGFPPKLRRIFDPAPYKIMMGGRGGGKSWSAARALLLMGLDRPLRILCARETQHSIRDSVHKLLVNQIANLGLADRYKVQQVNITGNREWDDYEGDEKVKRYTEFIFTGISDQTAASIKSFEQADICWVEEGQVVSETSWTLLIPTLFRRPGCELWVTLNPGLDTDPTWEEFMVRRPPGALYMTCNWSDNPWFPPELNEKRKHDKATRPKWEYEWIWEGKCRPSVSGAVYPEEMANLYAEGRILDLPVDRSRPVYAIFDLGSSDATAIILCQRVLSRLMVVGYIENHHKAVDWYSSELRKTGYDIAELFLPHDGKNDTINGPSPQRQFEDLGWRVTALPNQPVEHGIQTLRNAFPQLYIDRKCQRLVECLRRYRRIIPSTTKHPSHPAHDEFSHGADAARYMALAAPYMDAVKNGEGLQLPKLDWKWGFK
jgi:phage terminase large subunit